MEHRNIAVRLLLQLFQQGKISLEQLNTLLLALDPADVDREMWEEIVGQQFEDYKTDPNVFSLTSSRSFLYGLDPD